LPKIAVEASETSELSGGVRKKGNLRGQKFQSRKDAIVRAAVRLINRRGVKGMTMADVAAELEIVPTAIIYYFSNKEELVVECYRRGIDAYERLIEAAQRGATRVERLRLFVKNYFDLRRDIALGLKQPISVFDDLRAQNNADLNTSYITMFRNARSLLGPAKPPPSARAALNACTHLVLSQLFWAVVWLPQYRPEAHDRAADRMLDILEHGIGLQASPLTTKPLHRLSDAVQGKTVTRETFLRAATQLINEQGYHGASAEKISARLNVTKGSFYHHIDAKDDLVAACFERTVQIMERAQKAATNDEDSGWEQLCSSTLALVEHQVSGEVPLLRTSALNSVPSAVKFGLVDRFSRTSLTFGSMICDGIADGSIRPVDTFIAAQMITAMINAVAELDLWTPGLEKYEAVDVFVRPLLSGLQDILE
jgi:AcrR family transcriptional regulator